ncbi:MAG: FAD-dependent oxidoreductase [Rhodobacteraceae bacterium]|nr:FAD-dependent oxidoreductase [Paracoccaceae bacterium]
MKRQRTGPSDRPEAIVVGAGIAGAMTALALLRKGCSTTLIDRWEPGHVRASSSDVTRILRMIHGRDELYTEWVREARLRWLELQEEMNCTLFVQCGALILAGRKHTAWEDETLVTFEKLGVPHFRLGSGELEKRFPQFCCHGIEYGILETESGLLMAKRGLVQTVGLFQREGGRLVRGRVETDTDEQLFFDGKPLEADIVVVAAGPWLGGLFPRSIKPIVKVVRQDIVYTSTPDSETGFDASRMPCWVDHGYGGYGTPSVEGSGVKAAIAWAETVIDLDDDERVVDDSAFHRTRQYVRHRFPGLVGQRVVDQKACQITTTPDTHFILDFHPWHGNVLVVGGCSGHLFKHGPVVGEFAAGVAMREWGTPKRFKIGKRSELSVADSPSGR